MGTIAAIHTPPGTMLAASFIGNASSLHNRQVQWWLSSHRMAAKMKINGVSTTSHKHGQRRRHLVYLLAGTAIALLIPLLWMQFSDDVRWDLFDFAAAGALLLGGGAIWLLGLRFGGSSRGRLLFGVGLSLALLLVWVELAVGVFGTPLAGS